MQCRGQRRRRLPGQVLRLMPVGTAKTHSPRQPMELLSLDVERDDVPNKPGVYVVLRESTDPPTFLAESPAGVRKGRNVPTVEKLAAKWVDNCAVVYVGMTTRPLAARLDEFREMGFGGKNHYGGRNVLQLAQGRPVGLLAGDCRGRRRGH